MPKLFQKASNRIRFKILMCIYNFWNIKSLVSCQCFIHKIIPIIKPQNLSAKCFFILKLFLVTFLPSLIACVKISVRFIFSWNRFYSKTVNWRISSVQPWHWVYIGLSNIAWPCLTIKTPFAIFSIESRSDRGTVKGGFPSLAWLP